LLQRSTDLVSLLPTGVADLFSKHKMLRVLNVRLKSRSQTFGIVTRKGGVLSLPARELVQLLKERARI
jgi:hypothetical protein